MDEKLPQAYFSFKIKFTFFMMLIARQTNVEFHTFAKPRALAAIKQIMVVKCEIIMLKWHHNRGDFIFVRLMDNENEITIPEGSVFGDIPIYEYKEMSGSKDKDGKPYFVLRPMAIEFLPKDHFHEGQFVDLIIERAFE